MIKLYQLKNKVWEVVGYGCPHCKQKFVNEQFCIKHQTKCINTTKKQKEKP